MVIYDGSNYVTLTHNISASSYEYKSSTEKCLNPAMDKNWTNQQTKQSV